MFELFNLLRNGITVTALDVDNTLYMTAVLDENPPTAHRRLLFWGLFAEFIGRLLLIYFFLVVLGGRDVTFSLLGFEFGIEDVALIAAGLFLLIKNGRELTHILLNRSAPEDPTVSKKTFHSFPRLITEITIVNITLSFDTIIAITSSNSSAGMILYLLLFSAIFRYLFVRQIANIIETYPSLNIIILAFLIIIGLELIMEGIGFNINEVVINLIILAAVGLASLHERRRPTISRWWQQQKKSQ